MSRLVVVLTKPKQQLRASHSSSIIPLPVAVSLLLPRRISSAEDIYPTSDFSPRVTVLFCFVLFSLKPGCFWISGAQRVLFLYFWLLPDSLITIGTKTCRGDAAELLVPLYLLYIFLYFLYLAKLKMSEVERHVVFRPKLCALKLRAWCKAPLYQESGCCWAKPGFWWCIACWRGREVNPAAGTDEQIKRADCYETCRLFGALSVQTPWEWNWIFHFCFSCMYLGRCMYGVEFCNQ